MSEARIGELLRSWRHRRRRSQLDVASAAGVSARHLSFVENGRSRPSPEVILAVARYLEVPLRERNALLLAAGYAPRFGQTPLDDVSMARVRASLQRMLAAHDPYPGVIIDRQWNVVMANDSANALVAGVSPHVLEPKVNVFRLCLHPDGLAAVTVNFDDWAAYLLGQIRRLVRATADAELAAIEDEVRSYPNVAGLEATSEEVSEPAVLVPLVVDFAGSRLSMFTTLTTFGTPLDITLDELAVELFFPADDATDRLLGRAGTAAAAS